LARPALIAAMAVGERREEPAALAPARFDALYKELRSPVRAYLRRVTGSHGSADDLAQETWVRVLMHPPRTLEPAAARSYVFTIASRLARDAWRRESWIGRWIRAPRRRDVGRDEHDAFLETVADRAPAPDARHEAREDVERSLRSLTARERSLLWLAHVEQYDHREIAAMLDLRPESVRVLLHRARRRALAALQDPEARTGGSA
jgi:RNA polymerase sigma-70 factor, ECF subfamily